MIHKILIYIGFDEMDYISNLHAVLPETDDTMRNYLEEEAEIFLNTIIEKMDANEDDLYDLYLVKEKRATDENLQANMNKLKLVSAPESTWTQDEAYKLMSEKLGFSDIDLSDLENEIFQDNSEDRIKISGEFHSNNDEKKINHMEEKMVKENESKSNKEPGKPPSLAELMKKIQQRGKLYENGKY